MTRPGASPPGSDGSHRDGEMRCPCGSLLARVVRGGLEIKCKRCKRIQWIPLSIGEGKGKTV